MKTGLSLLRSFLSSNASATKSKKTQSPRAIGEAKITGFDNDRSVNKYLFFEYEIPIDLSDKNMPEALSPRKKTKLRFLRDFFLPFHKKSQKFFDEMKSSFAHGNTYLLDVIKEIASDTFEKGPIDKKSLEQMIFITAKHDEKLSKLIKKIDEQEFNKPGAVLMILMNCSDNEKERALMKRNFENLKQYISSFKPNLNICMFCAPIKDWRYGAKGIINLIGIFFAQLLKVKKDFVMNMFDGDITNFDSKKVIAKKYEIAKDDVLVVGNCAEDIGELYKKDPLLALEVYFHQIVLNSSLYPVGANMACKASTYIDAGGIPLKNMVEEDNSFIKGIRSSGRTSMWAGHFTESPFMVYCDGDAATIDYQSDEPYGSSYTMDRYKAGWELKDHVRKLEPDRNLTDDMFIRALLSKSFRDVGPAIADYCAKDKVWYRSDAYRDQSMNLIRTSVKEDLGIDVVVNKIVNSGYREEILELTIKYEGTIKDRLENYIKQNFSE